MARSIKDYLVISFKGIGMGAADVVPGVSGGTIAFITGIYEELLNSIKSVNLKSIKILFKDGVPSFWKAINGSFLLPLLLGIGISVISLAKLMTYLLDNHPILVWSFFFGLIIASAIYIGRTIKKYNIGVIIAVIAGAVAAYFITVISPANANTAEWYIFLTGAVAICAMILPGISGSFILLLLGNYKFMMEAIDGRDLTVIALFGGGALVGLLSFANILSWLLKKFENITIAVLAGFMIGSLNKVWPWKEDTEFRIDSHGEKVALITENIGPAKYEAIYGQNPQLLYAILLAVAGIALVFAIELVSEKSKKA